ncbi:uncharacterized protein LOC115765302 [Drosophila novamexicana]|uniref:uncharacterized protein LOC115765302 n=1 Tax=Drosophila novamexicana TaxID=47314 RepID=UPI0011E5AB57|nr:uncharacterized protein LOC115765302 [Drosophila novamexicana]XP_030564658.1 uncharacterized protein LOC115765302 [Drosophila novamexicana]
MEYMQYVEPTRAEMLEQLRKRELYVPNVESLPIDQLQQIYNGFIVPHPRRERRERQRTLTEMALKCANEIPMDMEQLTKRIKVVCMAGEKRPIQVEPQSLLTISPKRIKIDLHR